MTTVTVWGDEALVAAIRSALASLTEVSVVGEGASDLAGNKAAEALGPRDYAVLQAKQFTDRKNRHKAVDILAAKDVPTAILFDVLESGDLKKAALAPNVDIAIEATEDAAIRKNAVDLIVSRVTKLARPTSRSTPSTDLVGIGGLVTIGEVEDGDKPDFPYREAGFRSLVPLDGGDFAREVRDVVAAMAAYPLREWVPWDPQDRQPRGKATRTPTPQTPNLQDLMQAFSLDAESTKNLPRTRDEVIDLLKGEHSKKSPEPKSAHDRWRKAWDQGRPPLLLLEGRTGVGKSFMAEYITFLLTPRRSNSTRNTESTGDIPGMLSSRARFVKFNGAGLTLQDFNHYLMGAAPGVFTGIPDAVVGQITRAAHGVFFLDEIGDMAPDVQAAFLTFLDSREIKPAGMHPPFQGFQHIIAATNRPIDQDVKDEKFRKDLLARFALRLWIPPLSDASRHKHLPRFIDYLAQDPVVNPRREDGTYAVGAFTQDAHTDLLGRQYENGNFRELTAAVHGAIREARRRHDDVVTVDDVKAATTRRTRPGESAS